MQADIHIFHHVGQVNNWDFVLQEQVHAMQISGLVSACKCIHFGISGNRLLTSMPSNSTVKFFPQIVDEKETLKMVRDFCKNNPNTKIFYIHTKGVTKQKISVNSWRLYMEYFCVHKWKDCVSDLNTHDCVGSLWADATSNYPSHFSGNIWWANASYINDRVNHNLLETDSRFDREFWIGSGNPKVKKYGINNAPKLGDFFFDNTMSSQTICGETNDSN